MLQTKDIKWDNGNGLADLALHSLSPLREMLDMLSDAINYPKNSQISAIEEYKTDRDARILAIRRAIDVEFDALYNKIFDWSEAFENGCDPDMDDNNDGGPHGEE